MIKTMQPSQNKTTLSARILSVVLAAFLVLTLAPFVPNTSHTAEAAVGIQPGINIQNTNTATATTIAFGGMEWVVIGYDGAGVAGAGGALSPDDTTATLLLRDASLFPDSYDVFSNSGSADYANSGLRFKMTAAYDALGTGEQSLVDERVLAASTAVNSTVTTDFDTIYGENDINAYFWSLSTKEASTVNSTLRQYDFGWWLRSPGDAPEFAATVIGDSGDVFQSGSRVGDARSLRPAFKLDLSSVFFTSSATVTDSKSSVGVGGGLVAAAAPTGTVKLTVEDDAQEMELQATLAQSTQSVATSESLKFSYVDATSGTNQYVSCVWTDDNDSNAPTYYGKLADSSSTASGTLSIPLGGVADGIYTVSVFSEQANGDTYTDFASTPTTMTVTVASGTATVSNFGGTILSDDATLQSLNVSAGTLDPVFSFTTTSYTVDVDNTQDSIDITGTANHASATVSGTGTKSLSVGANNFTITVTAEDGVTTKDHTITVTRAAAPTKADATKNTFSVTGGLSQTTNTDFTITAQGDLQDATGAVVGDTRYLPKQASANPTISFPASAPYTATMKITKAGSYTLSVTFEEQEWTGSAWVATGVTDTKSQPLTVADAKSNPKPLPDDGKNKLAPTGDGIPYLPIAISFVIFLGLIVIAAKRKSTNNTK